MEQKIEIRNDYVVYVLGKGGICWIRDLLSLILFFYVPVGIMLLFNAVALIWTIFSIRKVTKVYKIMDTMQKINVRR